MKKNRLKNLWDWWKKWASKLRNKWWLIWTIVLHSFTPDTDVQDPITGKPELKSRTRFWYDKLKGTCNTARPKYAICVNPTWKAAATKHNILDKTRIVDGSQCCQICREKYPETSAWQKNKHYKMCECISFNTGLKGIGRFINKVDPTKYERIDDDYSIGYCK